MTTRRSFRSLAQRLMRRASLWQALMTALPLTVMTGCNSKDPPVLLDGSAEVGVGALALSVDTDVTRVAIHITGPGMAPMDQDLFKVDGQWHGVISGIPAGLDRVFSATAYDANNVELFSGVTTGVEVQSGSPVLVMIVLQESNPPSPYSNNAPRITSVIASDPQTVPNQTISLHVDAVDGDGDTLNYAWSATGGTLNGAVTANPTWTAPSIGGAFNTLTVRVDDGHGAESAFSFQVLTLQDTGGTSLATEFNIWPYVQGITAGGQVAAGETTDVSVNAFDADNDPLTYTWSDNCGGSFSAIHSSQSAWTAPSTPPMSGTCTLTAAVADNRGGSGIGTVVIQIGQPPAINIPPVIDTTLQQADTLGLNAITAFYVRAHDPEGTSLSFAWSATSGTIELVYSEASDSTMQWSAPSTVGHQTITATVTDADGGQTTHSFNVAVKTNETCNGMDDDLDGTADNDPVDVGNICGSSNTGVCKYGMSSCQNGALVCIGAVNPTQETCNGLDDDCNDLVDDGVNMTVSCGVGACATTVNTCQNGTPNVCTPLPSSTEVCNGIDDDCNGTPDDGLGTISCGVGACATTVNACASGQPNTCTPLSPTNEVCNGIDDDCDGVVDDGAACGPSCDGLARNCGPNHDQNCCASPLVTGGTYNRYNNATYPATVSDFRLNQFEVTVGRFRKFVEAYPDNKPLIGMGAHPQIADSGWDPSWGQVLPIDQAALISTVKCDPTYQTWTDVAGANEQLPMNCLDWYTAFAFCAWDSGRLPTEAEWNYAAAGGNEQRVYPWSGSTINGNYAVYNCLGNGSLGGACSFADILSVGSKSPGNGKWGQADLAGSMLEWTLDLNNSLPIPCNDCAAIGPNGNRTTRGGSWYMQSAYQQTTIGISRDASIPHREVGVRCVQGG